jgi:cbb3-type cytochrome oxidase maturation protein
VTLNAARLAGAMTALAWLIPVTLLLGGLGLCAFLWALRAGQFEDLEGASYRALEDDAPDDPPQ